MPVKPKVIKLSQQLFLLSAVVLLVLSSCSGDRYLRQRESSVEDGKKTFNASNRPRKKRRENDAFAFRPFKKKQRRRNDPFSYRQQDNRRKKERDAFTYNERRTRRKNQRDPFSSKPGRRNTYRPKKEADSFTYRERFRRQKHKHDLFAYDPPKKRRRSNGDPFKENQDAKPRDPDKVFFLSKKNRVRRKKDRSRSNDFSYSRKKEERLRNRQKGKNEEGLFPKAMRPG